MLTFENNLEEILKRLFPGIEIDEKIKPSGQRSVYFCHFKESAEQKQINWGNCVIKITPELSARQIAYLQKEIEILNSLESSFYPTLYLDDVFSADPVTEEKFPKRLFITIEERIDALPLTQCKHLYTDETSVINFLFKMVDGLSLLWEHEKKLVHRDLKPDNILVKSNKDIVIIDLGILREEGTIGLTATFAPYGPCSPAYASPEQARNDRQNISFKSDFFSLGTIAYELIAGSNPFVTSEGISIDDVLENAIKLNPPTLYSLNKSSPEFSRLIAKMMEKELYKRHRTIDAIKADLLSLQLRRSLK